MSTSIHNPVLRGFNPDPSFVRVGNDYYIATSTFEWFPGVQIHHSRDLVHWRLIGQALTRVSQLDLRGVPDSGGIWAPSLSFAGGKFWLVYTIVRTWGAGRPFKDTHNYLVTASSIEGPWSEPVFLHSRGFDASLFHDDDGRKWIVGIEWDYREGRPRFGGIILQEFDPQAGGMVGPVRKILQKQVLIEGPNLYRHGGWYYLMLAEGGTGWAHSISMARSRDLGGPYELDTHPVVLTANDDPGWPLQKAGHGELVETPAGEWYLAHLCSRAFGPERRCILGRETALQQVVWSPDGWLRLSTGGVHPLVEVAAPAGLPVMPWPARPARDDFERDALSPEWSTLRVPASEGWLSLRERPGWLRLRGRECPHSLHDQSLVAQRLQTFRCVAETRLAFAPTHFTQAAGLVCWYDTRTHFALRMTHDESRGPILGVVLTDDGKYQEPAEGTLSVAGWSDMYLRADIAAPRLTFSASPDGMRWQRVGPDLDVTKLSDDYGQGLHFTGAFVGLYAQDLAGTRAVADFDYFELREIA